MPSCGGRVRSSARAVAWRIGCWRGTRGSPPSSGCSTSCAVDAADLEVGVRTLRSAAATRTEEAEGGDHDQLESDAPYGSAGSPRIAASSDAAENQQGPSLV